MAVRLRTLRWLIPVSLAALLLLGEGALRIRQYLRYGTFGSVHEFAVHEPTGLRMPIPGKVTGTLSIDSRGFRNAELETPKPAGRLRLAFLGGSTTFCAEATSNESTWPHRVAEAVAQARGGEVDYINGGVPGYTVDSSLRNFEARVAPEDPDVVFVYHAYNDLVSDARELAMEAGLAKPEPAVDWLGERSLLWHLLRQNIIVRHRVGQVQAAGTLDVDPTLLAEGFEARLNELVAAIQASGAKPVLVTFCYRGRGDMAPEEQRQAAQSAMRYMPYLAPDRILEGIGAYNDAMRRVAESGGATLIECSESVPASGDHFNDSVHLLDTGCKELATEVAKQLLSSGVLPN